MIDSSEDKTGEALQSIADELLDYFDRGPVPLFVPSEPTLRHRRSLMFWSTLVIAVLGLGLWPERVPVLDVKLDEASRDYFTIAAVALLAYHTLMYRLLEYRDLLLRYTRMAIVNFAFIPKLERATSRFESTNDGQEYPQEWMTQRESVMERLQSESPIANRLLAELVRWPPALLLGAAMFFLARTYTSLATAYSIATVLVLLVFWLERRLRKRAFARADIAAAPSSG